MASLDFALVGLAILPFTFFYFALKLPANLVYFRIILIPFGLLSSVVFLNELVAQDATFYNIGWALNWMVIAIFVLYLTLEMLNLIVFALSRWTTKRADDEY